MFDINSLMGKVQEAQKNLKKAQENLVNITAEAEAGGGMVKVKINGKRQVIQLDIDSTLLTPSDKEMVQDLVIAATNNAIEKIDVQIKQEMQQSTAGVMPNIPGFDPSQFM